jgi:ankyrin repeat protein
LGFTAVASDVSDPRVVRSLLDNKANSAIKSKDGETALDWALKFGNPEILRLLGSSPLKRKLAVKPTAYSNGDAAAVVGRAIPLLQKSANEFFKQSGCVGCHHQNLSGFAVAAASRKGVSVDEKPIAEQRLIAKSELLRERENVLIARIHHQPRSAPLAASRWRLAAAFRSTERSPNPNGPASWTLLWCHSVDQLQSPFLHSETACKTAAPTAPACPFN